MPIQKKNDHWLWTGFVMPDGYGRIKINGKNTPAHRVFFAMYKGLICKGLTVDHKCRIRNCVNPAHLRLLTMRENILCGEGVAAKNAARTHCIRNHKLAGKNIKRVGRRRLCLICRRTWDRERYHRNKTVKTGETENG